MIPPAGVLLIASLVVGDAPDAGWTSYPPLSLVTGQVGEGIWIMSVLLLDTSSILGFDKFPCNIAEDAYSQHGHTQNALVLLGDVRHFFTGFGINPSTSSRFDSAFL